MNEREIELAVELKAKSRKRKAEENSRPISTNNYRRQSTYNDVQGHQYAARAQREGNHGCEKGAAIVQMGSLE